MKRFLRTLFLLLLPAVVLYGLFAAVLASSREMAGMGEIVAATVGGSLQLYGTSHHENFATYKRMVTEALAPRLLVLGTSRCMQLRGEFFAEKSFYNAGGAVRNMADYIDFLRALPEGSLPDTLLLVLDQNMFNTGWRASSPQGPQEYDVELEMDWLDTLLRTGVDYGNGKFRIFENLLPRPGIYGLAAAARGMGFAADGSYRYGLVARQNLDRPQANFAATYRDIDGGRDRFAYGSQPDAVALDQLDQLLDFCAGQGIRVVGLLPPFPPSVNERMDENGGYGYIPLLGEALAGRFVARGGEFYDFTRIESEDAEYLDGFHGGDRVYGRIALALARQSTLLRGMVAEEATRQLLARPGNPRAL